MIKEGVAPRKEIGFRELEANQAFADGKAVFMRNWSDSYGFITDPKRSSLKPDQIGIAPIPTAAPGARSFHCLGGWNLMISSKSDPAKMDAAWSFIQFMTAREQQRFMALKGFLPTRIDLYTDPEIMQKVPAIEQGQDVLKNSRIRPVSPFYMQISPRIARAFNRVLKEELTGTQAVQGLQKELQTLLRKNR